MDGGQVGILEQGHEVSLGGLLKSHNGRGLEAQVGLESCASDHEIPRITTKTETDLEVLSDFTNKTLEGQLADQEFGGLLITPEKLCEQSDEYNERKRDIPDLTKGYGTGAEPVGLLDTTSGVLNTKNTRQGESSVVIVRGPQVSEGGRATHLPRRSSLRPWWRAAYEEPFLENVRREMSICVWKVLSE